MTAKPTTQSESPVTVRLEPELRAGLAQLFDRDGIKPSESIRRAVRAWLEAKDIRVDVKARKRKAK